MKRESYDNICEFLRGKLSAGDMREVEARLGREIATDRLEDDPEFLELDDEERRKEKRKLSNTNAMDAALRPYGSAAVRAVAAYNEAVRFCTPVLGSVPLALDSAEAVYGAALQRLGIDTRRVSPSAYRFILENAGHGGVKSRPTTAQDRAALGKHSGVVAALDKVTQL